MPVFTATPGQVIDPRHVVYAWYEATALFIQQVRSNGGTCPRCGGVGTLQDTVRGVSCTQCDLRASVAAVHAWDPREFQRSIARRLDGVWRDLVQLKADLTYRDADVRSTYDALQAREKVLQTALDDVKQYMSRPYILLPASD